MVNLLKKPWALIALSSVFIAVGIFMMGGVDFDLRATLFNNEEKSLDEETVVSVDDVQFSYLEFKSIMEQVEMNSFFEGKTLTEEEIKEEALEMAINQGVLIKYAEQEGFTPSDGCIEDRFQEILEMYMMTEEEFLSELKEEGIDSKAEINELLKAEIMVSRLYDSFVEKTEVEDSVIKEAYDEYVDGLREGEVDEEEIPSFEEMEEMIKEGMKHEKAIDELFAKAEEIRGNFKVEIFIENFDF